MRRKLVSAASAGLLVAAVGIPAGSLAATGKKGVSVKCSANYVNPTPTKTTGVAFGLVSCGSPLGKGVQVTNYTDTVGAGGAITVSGPTKLYTDLGTIHGTITISGKLTGSTLVGKGSGKIAGGTGRFKGAKGTAPKVTCTTTDAGAHYSCSFTLKLSKL